MDRKGRVAAAIGVVVLTLAVVAFFAFAAVFSMNFCTASPCPQAGAGGITFVVVFLSLLFLLGMWWAWMVGTGRLPRHAGESLAAPCPTLSVAEGGADVRPYPGRGERITHLPAGMPLRELRVRGEQGRVATLDGLEGWVDADRLEPTIQPSGDGKGAPMGESR